jgi:hypothetical protein
MIPYSMGTKQREISTRRHLQAYRYYYYHAISTKKETNIAEGRCLLNAKIVDFFDYYTGSQVLCLWNSVLQLMQSQK